MKKEDCYEFGYVAKTHGLMGEITIMLDVDDPAAYTEIDALFIERKGQLVPFFVESLRPSTDRMILKLEEVDTVEQASQLKGGKLFLPLSALPEPEKGSFYFHDIIGYRLHGVAEGLIGEVKAIYTDTSQPIFSVMHQGKEVLIPFSDELMDSVDHEGRQIMFRLPEGLLDLYLSDAATVNDEEE